MISEEKKSQWNHFTDESQEFSPEKDYRLSAKTLMEKLRDQFGGNATTRRLSKKLSEVNHNI